jgi:hypothetical protein
VAKKGIIIAGAIGTAIAVGATVLIARELEKPGTQPPNTEPPLDPTVITFFDVTPKSGVVPLSVGISINVVGTKTRTVFKFGDGTPDRTFTSGTSHIENHNYLQSGTFLGSVIATREDGKKETANFTITVSKVPVPPSGQNLISSFYQSKSAGQIPFEVSISASAGKVLQSASVDWGDGTITQLGSNLNADHTYTKVGVFSGKLTLNAIDGESETRNFTVNASGSATAPSAEIVPTGFHEGEYTFFANFQGQGLTYKWNFGDGTPIQTAGQTVSHQYTKVGTFTVSIEVTDSSGQKATDTVSVSIMQTDLQAELGDATLNRIADNNFDYAWNIINTLNKALSLEFVLRVFNQAGSEAASSVTKNIDLAALATQKVGYNVPFLGSGIFNLEVELQDRTTHQLVAYYSDIIDNGSSTSPPPSGSTGNVSFIVPVINVIKFSDKAVLAGSGSYINNKTSAVTPVLTIQTIETSSQFGTLVILNHTVLPYEIVPANSTEGFEFYMVFKPIAGARYKFVFTLKVDNATVQTWENNWQN